MTGRGGLTAVAAAIALLGAAGPARAFDQASEARNFSKTQERFRYESGTPAYQAKLRVKENAAGAEALAILAADPERMFLGSLCWQHFDGCAGDVRFYDWDRTPDAIRRPVLFTARNGATISGHVWATATGPAKRPGVVLTNGSVQAPEELYAFAAATLARAGYVVLTWDPQGQGRSDTVGEAPDRLDGVPSQTGRPFFDGTEDALDFFLSTPDRRYVPRVSCTTGTSHAAKQRRRVRAGLNAAYDPLWQMVDPTRIGLVGHSLGAMAVSYIGQVDPRVKAVVAYDNLSAPSLDGIGQPITCPKARVTRPPHPPIVHPALGLSADYGLTPTPYTSAPDPLAKSQGSLAASRAGVDTGELVIRGGTHYEFSFVPNPAFPATLRGLDLVAWYTRAWLDKELMGDPTADARLFTRRWRADATEASVDPGHDGNLFSAYYRSRLDVTLAGGSRATCEDLRAGCPALVADDGERPRYTYLRAAGLDPP